MDPLRTPTARTAAVLIAGPDKRIPSLRTATHAAYDPLGDELVEIVNRCSPLHAGDRLIVATAELPDALGCQCTQAALLACLQLSGGRSTEAQPVQLVNLALNPFVLHCQPLEVVNEPRAHVEGSLPD